MLVNILNKLQLKAGHSFYAVGETIHRKDEACPEDDVFTDKLAVGVLIDEIADHLEAIQIEDRLKTVLEGVKFLRHFYSNEVEGRLSEHEAKIFNN